MIRLYIPKYEDLWFRKMFMADVDTMSYNHAWGGTISFPEEDWNEWYQYWIVETENKRFYRYLMNDENEFVGEIAYHLNEIEDKYIANVIIYSKHRGKGYGEQGLNMLCNACQNTEISVLYDNIAIDNPAIKLFQKCGFFEEYRTEEVIMLKKFL